MLFNNCLSYSAYNSLSRDIKISKFTLRVNFQKIGIIFFAFYIFTSGLFPVPLQVFIIFISLFCEIYSLLKRICKIYFSNLDSLYATTFFFVLYNNANIRRGEFRNIVEYFVIFLFFVNFRIDARNMGFLISCIEIFSFLHAIFTIILYFIPDIYLNYIMTIFNEELQKELYIQYKNGWMAGIAPHYSTNGMYLGIGLGAALSNILNQKRSRTLQYIFFIVITVALLMTGKRAHTLFGILSCFVTVLLSSDMNVFRKLIRIIFRFSLIVVLVFALSNYIPAIFNVMNRFITTAQKGNLTMGRNILWKTAIHLWKEKPLLGIGWDQFKYLAPGLVGYYLNVHNVYIQLLCEVGIAGSIIFYSFFIISLKHCVQVSLAVLKNIYSHNQYRSSILFSLYMQTFFLSYCITGNPLYDAQVFFPYICGCAIIEYQYCYIFKNKEAPFGLKFYLNI